MAQISCYIVGISVVGERVYASGISDELPIMNAEVAKADLDAQPTPAAKQTLLATAMRVKQLRGLVLDPAYAALKGHVSIQDPGSAPGGSSPPASSAPAPPAA